MRLPLVAALAFLVSSPSSGAQDAASAAKEIFDASGVRGGFVVHLGCGDGTLTLALRAHEGFQVQGLDRDSAAVEKARAFLRSKGAYGPVSVDRLSANRLPYIDNLVNLVVAEDL